jgi:hypothetical protein
MSLQAKKTKWRRSLKPRAMRLVEHLNREWFGSSLSELGVIVAQELGDVASHYYKLGRAAGIAEGRKRERAGAPT